jgi:hypothetical protein
VRSFRLRSRRLSRPKKDNGANSRRNRSFAPKRHPLFNRRLHNGFSAHKMSVFGPTSWTKRLVTAPKSELDGRFYTGYTRDLRKRFQQHNDGKVPLKAACRDDIACAF